MTDGTRILRTVGVPLTIAVILLVVLPRMCARAIDASHLQSAPSTASTGSFPSTDTTDGGLHISTTSPDAASSPPRPQNYPAGLDATRIQYLVEIDPSFVSPATARIPKGDLGLSTDSNTRFPLVSVVLRLGYFQAAGGAYAPTREAALHLDGLTEDGAGWTVPIAKRKFDSVSHMEDLGDGRYRATFRWRWEPNAVGSEVLSKPRSHEAAAEFIGGERHWALVQMNRLDQLFE